MAKSENQPRLKPGDVVKHFKREELSKKDRKNTLKYVYIINHIAKHTETGEQLVVYTALYKSKETGEKYGTHCRPLDMFMSEVDHEKYPNIEQKYRFEKFD